MLSIFLLLILLQRVCSNGGLRIIHTNDIHSHYDESNVSGKDCTAEQVDSKQCYGGLARLKTAIDSLRRESEEDSLLLDAGDQFQGTLFYGYYRGNVTWTAMNLLGYDAMAPGNHEFDNGPDNFARVAEHFKFPLVCSNLVTGRHPTLSNLVKSHVLFPEKKVALVGYITPKLPSISNLGPLLDVLDPAPAVQEAIDHVRSLGYTNVIALSHNGYDHDIELVSKLHGLSLVVGGHSHSYLAPKQDISNLPAQGRYPTPVQDKHNRTAYIVHAYCWSRFLGSIDIKFGEDGYLTQISGAPIDLNSEIAKDSSVDLLVRGWRIPFDEYGKTEIGEAAAYFDRQTCHNQECTLGNFLADVMLNYRKESDLAILNSGDIRYGIDQGTITVADIQSVLPYGSSVVTLNLTGQQIWDLVEGVLSRISVVNGGKVTSFIQVANLNIIYKSTNPVFSKIQSIQTKHKTTLNLEREYTVTTTDFIAKGGDNIISPPIPAITLATLDQVAMDFIKSNSPISPPRINRIINLDG